MLKVNNKDNKLTSNIFTSLPSVFIADLEQINVYWELPSFNTDLKVLN